MSQTNPIQAAIFGLEGLELNDAEKQFFTKTNPLGYILFKRNCESKAQVKALTDSLRELAGRDDLLILIDQEGGRVCRLQPPVWEAMPAAQCAVDIADKKDEAAAKRAAYLHGFKLAQQCAQVGVSVNCAPLADIPVEGAHDIIGDRALGRNAQQVATLAREQSNGLLAGGVLPVLKHIPGHGRATVDSHEALPVVSTSLEELRKTDFAPFKALNDIPLGMTAHIIYEAIDNENIATQSPKLIDLIRNEIGFDGLLMSDDLSMKAMTGSYKQRTASTLAAGCDLVLHCNGLMDQMQQVAEGLSALSEASQIRLANAWKILKENQQTSCDIASMDKEFKQLLQSVA